MIHHLSILIPTYNHVCLELVKSLQAQAASLSSSQDFEYEILVADDGSTDVSSIEENRAINDFSHCRYIEREKNVGRAVIRNFLAQEAQYPWLLFIDSDLRIDNPYFLKNYSQAKGSIIVGGLKIGGNPDIWANNLRYRYEKACEKAHDYLHRIKNGDKEFRTTNFMIEKTLVTKECPFDENFKHYGYEDVLLGKQLTAKGYHITHIDNPILLDQYEGNYQFLLKTEEACRTLYLFRAELNGYSKILAYAQKVRKWHLYPICQSLFPLLSLPIKARLTGNKPSKLWFNIYKLLYYIHLDT